MSKVESRLVNVLKMDDLSVGGRSVLNEILCGGQFVVDPEVKAFEWDCLTVGHLRDFVLRQSSPFVALVPSGTLYLDRGVESHIVEGIHPHYCIWRVSCGLPKDAYSFWYDGLASYFVVNKQAVAWEVAPGILIQEDSPYVVKIEE